MALVEVPFDDGGWVVVEMDDAGAGVVNSDGVVTGDGVVKAGRAGEVAGRAVQSLESALAAVGPAARVVLAKVREAGPQQVTVDFGVKLSSGAGAVITRVSGECHFKVILRWEHGDGADQ